MTTLPFLAGFALLALATSFLAGALGMAGGMILMGVLLLILPVPAAMLLHSVTQLASNGWRAVLWAGHIDRGILGRYLIGMAAAFAVFTYIRFVPDRALSLLILGLSPFIVLALPAHLAIRADRRGGAEVCGLICTVLQLLSGVSGPVLDVFFVRTTLDRRVVVATKAACQVITHLSRIVYFGGIAGAAVASDWPIFVVAVLAAIIGTSLSRKVLERMTDGQFRIWTRRVVLTIGAIFVGQSLWLYAGL